MQICYISPVTTSLMLVPTKSDMNWMESAMSNAIQTAIVTPFHNWCYNVWNGFVDVSLPVCVTTSLAALAFTLIGVKKAKQWVIIPIIVYLFIQVINYIIQGG